MPTSKHKLQENRNKLLEYKKTLHCKQCGVNDHRLLEFHHVDNKDHNISNMVNHGYGWSRIQKEINKCIPLCANCHRLEHWNNQEERSVAFTNQAALKA